MMKNDFKKMKKMKKKKVKKNEKKNEKNSRKIAIFHFLENCNFPRFFHFFIIFFHLFILFFSLFIIVHHFLSFFINSTTGSKNDKKKNEKKVDENCNFFIFRIIFAPLEAKMMKND